MALLWSASLVTVLAIAASHEAATGCTMQHEGTCFQNHAHRIAQLASANSDDCCMKCSNSSSCRSFTWYEKGAVATCNLFSTVGDSTAGACTSGQPKLPPVTGKKNVLYFIVDDLRTQLGPYGHESIDTPNINKLASRGLTFTRAYCQEGVCAPSRTSFMSGRNPDSTRVWTFKGSFRSCAGCEDWVSLPQHFKNQGYLTLGGGKTYHPGRPANWDEPKSWSQDKPYFPFWEPGCPNPMHAQTEHEQALELGKPPGAPYNHSFCPLDLPLSEFFDHQLADWAIKTLHYASNQTSQRPFFINVGWRRPHLPWRMPLSFWNAAKPQAPPTNPHVPEQQPPIAFTCGDDCSFRTWLNSSTPHCGALCNGAKHTFSRPEPLNNSIAVLMRRAYAASVSFMDFEMGRVLDELKALGLEDDTLVVLHGDHGWGLGENNHWHKFTNSEDTARVPLLMVAPWKTRSLGKKTKAFASLVDLYPTMASLVSAGKPTVPVDGTDISAVLDDPSLSTYPHAFSPFPRCPPGGDPTQPEGWAFNYCKPAKSAAIQWMGYSVREEQLRATVWLKWNGTTLAPNWSSSEILINAELYDHTGDEGQDFDMFPLQHRNLAQDADRAKDVHRLASVLRDHFDHSLVKPTVAAQFV